MAPRGQRYLQKGRQMTRQPTTISTSTDAFHLGPDYFIPEGQQDARHRAGGTEVLAEEGGQGEAEGQHDDQHYQDDVLEIPQGLIPFEPVLLGNTGNQVQKLLQKAEGA